MPTYHFRLTPVDTYFFGDERSFGLPTNANYYVQSRPWPQQSSLLGALRFELLRRHGRVSDIGASHNLGSAGSPGLSNADLIGPAGFDPANTQGYGRIQRLSACWLEYAGQRYTMAPLDQALRIEAAGPGLRYRSLVSTQDQPLPSRFADSTGKPWLDKEGLTYRLARLDSQTSEARTGDPGIDPDKVFLPAESVGIIKREGQERDAGGFYRQRRYRLAPGWSFGFEAEIAEQSSDEHHWQAVPRSLITLGGEKLSFRLEATPQQQATPPVPQAVSGPCRVVLSSDAYLASPQALLDLCDYAFTGDPIDFRCVISSLADTVQYHNLTLRDAPRKKHRAGFSPLYQLLPRGSVFALGSQAYPAFCQSLRQQPWTQIGYNTFHLLSPLPSIH